MISAIKIKNYRSFINAEAKLSPFTLVIGPNGAGKSNLLRCLRDVFWQNTPNRRGLWGKTPILPLAKQRHLNLASTPCEVQLYLASGTQVVIDENLRPPDGLINPNDLGWYSIDPRTVGLEEPIGPDAVVRTTGKGAVAVLDSLKTGDREDLFETIERHLREYVPTVAKISTRATSERGKILQVREHHINAPFPVSELSEGTRLVLIILCIVFQENAPKVILLEDIDRGLHPRLFQGVVEMLRTTTASTDSQIIATTHNPYMLDQFVDHEDEVLIVEKEDGGSTITSLASRLDSTDSMEQALGELWYGGFVGGVPKPR